MWLLYVILDIAIFLVSFYVVAYSIKLECKKSQVTVKDVINYGEGLVFIGLIPFINILFLLIWGIIMLYWSVKDTKIL